MRIAVYYRVSTDKQDLASQEHAVNCWLEAFLRDKEASITVFKDEGKSGKDNQRPGFLALKAAVLAGEIDTIVVYRLDRLSRNAITAIQLLLDWIQRDLAFYSVSQPIFMLGKDNPFRLTMIALFSELAQIERETIVARVRAGLDAARKRGKKFGRPRVKALGSKTRRALELRSQGVTYQEIGKRLKISKGLAYKLVKNPDINLFETPTETLQ